MGRFYKTATPTFVDDIIYQAPHELMAKALQAQDANFENIIEPLEGTEALYENLSYVDKDFDARQEKVKNLNEKITSLSEKALKNPALAKGLRTEINKARKDLESDIKTGDLFKMDKAAKRREALRKKILDNKNISEEARNQALLKIDRDYQGFDQGEFSEDLHIYDKVDVAKLQKDLKMTINLDTIGTTTTKPDGEGYMIESGETKTYLKKERLEEIFTSDPTVDMWKREQLQTLERRFENGEFVSLDEEGRPFMDRAKMEKEYKDRLDNFKTNTIQKLGFKKTIESERKTSDPVYSQRLSRQQSQWQFNERRLDAMGSNKITEISGVIEEVDDAQIEELVGDIREDISIPDFSPFTPGGTAVKSIPMPTEKKRKIIEEEKKSLDLTLKVNSLTWEDFRNKMKTGPGRREMTSLVDDKGNLAWQDINKLSRQANYNKTFTYKTPVIEDYNELDPAKVREQKNYIATTLKSLNQLDVSTEREVIIIDEKGRSTKKTMSLSEAYTGEKNGFQLLQGTQTEYLKDVPKTNKTGRFLDAKGEELEIKENNVDRFMTYEEALQSGRLGYEKQKAYKLDTSKPLFNVKEEELFENQEYKFNAEHSAIKRDYFIVEKKAMNKEGKPVTVIFKIKK